MMFSFVLSMFSPQMTPMLAAVVMVGMYMTTAGMALQNPVLSSVGSILLGFAGGYTLGKGNNYLGGVMGASAAGLSSPVSPLSAQAKMAVAWTWTANCMLAPATQDLAQRVQAQRLLNANAAADGSQMAGTSQGASETASATKHSVDAMGRAEVDAARAAGYEPATNDMKVLHAANAYHGTRAAATWLTGASSGPLHYLGRLVVTPFVTVAGIGYEVYTGFTPFDGQPFLDWVWDTPGDLIANTYGQVLSLTVPNAWASSAIRGAQVIPGPNHVWMLRGGRPPIMSSPGGPNGLP